MKKTLTVLCLMIALAGCTYKKAGMIIKGSDGKFYKLKGAKTSESYWLEEIDTAEFKKLNHLP